MSLRTFIILLFKERVHLAQAVVLEHQQYLEAVRELTDWLISAGEELQTWSDASGDSVFVRKKLSEVRVRQQSKKGCLCSFYVHFCQNLTIVY